MKQVIAFLLIVLFISSCSDKSTAPVEDNNFKIGVLVPLEGSAKSTGKAVVVAINLAKKALIDEVKKDLERDINIEIIFEDTKADADVALEKLKYMKQQGVKFVIGPYSSSVAKSLIPFALDNDIVLISYSAVAVSLESMFDNFVRLVPSDKHQAKALEELLAYENVNYLGSIYRDDIWGGDLHKKLKELFMVSAGTNELTYAYTADDDLDDIVNLMEEGIKDASDEYNSENIAINLLSFAEGAEMLEYASDKEYLSELKWFGGSAFAYNASLPENEKAAEFAIKSNFRCAVFDAGVTNTDIINNITNQLGRAPEEYAYIAYDALKVAVLSLIELNKDKSQNPEGVVYNVCKYAEGITGSLTLNEFGDRERANYQIVNIIQSGNTYQWQKWGNYNSSTKELTIY